MRTAAIVVLAAIGVAACSVSVDVEVESRRDSGAPAPSAPGSAGDDDGTAAPTTTASATTTPAEPPGEVTEPVRFVLADVTVEVSLRPTTSTRPAGDTDGFTGALELGDGTFVASGFDGPDSEPSALWRSDDGDFWQSVGSEVGAPRDRQEIRDLVLDDTTVTAFGSFFDSATTPPRIEAVGRWTTGTEGGEWTTFRSLPATSVNRAAVFDGLVVTVGADRHDEPGGFGGVVAFWLGGVPSEVVPTDVDESGTRLSGSEVFDLGIDPGDGSWLAVGSTTITDSTRTGDEVATDLGENGVGENGVATDVALWRSVDSGRTWSAVPVPQFGDVPGAQRALDLLRVDERWWLLVEEETAGLGSELRLHVSDDGIDWTPDSYRRRPPRAGSQTTSTAGLYLVDGIVVVVDETVVGTTPSLVMTMIDPTTGATDHHDLTVELGGVVAVTDVIELADRVTGLGFGRVDRDPGTTDLQVIEIRRSDEQPDPDDPTPTTTSPPTGGGSSDA